MLFLIQKLHNWLKRKLDVIAYLTAENLALRQQLIVLKRSQGRPSVNAYVERLNGSIRRECTDHIIVWNEHHLKRILHGYFDYHNNDRTHLGLAKEAPVERPVS